MKFYIAHSIHGTNKFRVAVLNKRSPLRLPTSTSEDHVRAVLGEEFTAVDSRRPNYDLSRDGVKVHWTGLLTKEGKPMRSASWITRRFKELELAGWTLVDAKPCVY